MDWPNLKRLAQPVLQFAKDVSCRRTVGSSDDTAGRCAVAPKNCLLKMLRQRKVFELERRILRSRYVWEGIMLNALSANVLQ